MEEKERVFRLPSLITGYLLIGFAAFLLLALASFTPADSSWFVSKVNEPSENIAGAIGVSVASFFVIVYGRVSGFLADFAILVIGLNILIRAKTGRILFKASLFAIATVSLSVLVALVFTQLSFIDKGIIGIGLSRSLSEIIHPYVLIGIFGIMFLLSLSGTMKLFRFVAFFLARTIGQIALAPFHLFGLILKSDKDKQPVDDVLIDSGMLHGKTNRPAEAAGFDGERPHMPEPDFLRPPASSGNSAPTLIKPDEADLPSWLANPREKDRILLNIGKRYDMMIFGDGKTPVGETPDEPEDETVCRMSLLVAFATFTVTSPL